MSNNNAKKNYRTTMTVANIRDTGEPGCCEILFLESARFYKLDSRVCDFKKLHALLQAAMNKRKAVVVELESIDSDVILDANML